MVRVIVKSFCTGDSPRASFQSFNISIFLPIQFICVIREERLNSDLNHVTAGFFSSHMTSNSG